MASMAMFPAASRLCWMARAGCWMKRTSIRAKSSSSGPWGSRSGRRRTTSFSSRPMQGVRTSTVASRKREFRAAISTVFRGLSRKEKPPAAALAA